MDKYAALDKVYTMYHQLRENLLFDGKFDYTVREDMFELRDALDELRDIIN